MYYMDYYSFIDPKGMEGWVGLYCTMSRMTFFAKTFLCNFIRVCFVCVLVRSTACVYLVVVAHIFYFVCFAVTVSFFSIVHFQSYKRHSFRWTNHRLTSSYTTWNLQKGPPRFLTEGRRSMTQIRVSLCLLCLVVWVYWVVLSCVFFCVVWFCLLSWYLSCRRVFPFNYQIAELFTVMVYCMYSQHVTLSTFSD